MTTQLTLAIIKKLEGNEYYKKDIAAHYLFNLMKINIDNGVLHDDDEDLKAITPQLFTQLIDLLIGSYSFENLVNWITSQDQNVIKGFKHAETLKYDDINEVPINILEDCLFHDEIDKIIVTSW
jgi:hypothetical protein